MLPNEKIVINVYWEGVLTGSGFSPRGYLAISEDILDRPWRWLGESGEGVILVSRGRGQGDKVQDLPLQQGSI